MEIEVEELKLVNNQGEYVDELLYGYFERIFYNLIFKKKKRV